VLRARRKSPCCNPRSGRGAARATQDTVAQSSRSHASFAVSDARRGQRITVPNQLRAHIWAQPWCEAAVSAGLLCWRTGERCEKRVHEERASAFARGRSFQLAIKVILGTRDHSIIGPSGDLISLQSQRRVCLQGIYSHVSFLPENQHRFRAPRLQKGALPDDFTSTTLHPAIAQ
jgi:hypothetical protein